MNMLIKCATRNQRLTNAQQPIDNTSRNETDVRQPNHAIYLLKKATAASCSLSRSDSTVPRRHLRVGLHHSLKARHHGRRCFYYYSTAELMASIFHAARCREKWSSASEITSRSRKRRKWSASQTGGSNYDKKRERGTGSLPRTSPDRYRFARTTLPANNVPSSVNR